MKKKISGCFISYDTLHPILKTTVKTLLEIVREQEKSLGTIEAERQRNQAVREALKDIAKSLNALVKKMEATL